MWSDGYVTDIEYTTHYFHHLAPGHLRFVLTLKGLVGAAVDDAFDHMELGCGQGLTTLVLAACYPKARFFANDFNPAHVQRARHIAREAGLDNVTFLETSFADLEAADLPAFDFIACHGIYSWVTTENQRAIVAFADRHLRAGGLFSVSHNVAPGWSPLAPLQWFIRTYAEGLHGSSERRFREALGVVEEMAGSGAGYFAMQPAVRAAIARIKRESARYAAHEYLNGAWHLLTQHDMATQLAPAKLTFAASADMVQLNERLVLPDAQRAALAKFEGQPLYETVKDFLRNAGFRRDIYIRGGLRLSGGAREAAIAALPLALLRPRAACTLEAVCPVGKVQLGAAHAAMLDALVEGPQTLATLAGGGDGTSLVRAVQAAIRLAVAGHVAPCSIGWNGGADPAAVAATARLNRVLLASAAVAEPAHVLASPVVGGGIGVPQNARRAVLGTGDPLPADEAAVVAAAYGPLLRQLAVA
ncbi:MAG: class I SAM-dependent methyltransferase [Alphaproteobacteria bacterium]|nr:class I SAM-dependent methyltransferase [Alphaproteobacteria bacterium]